MTMQIEKSTAPDASVYLNKFSNEKVIVFTDTDGNKNFIHFDYKSESPLTSNHVINKECHGIIDSIKLTRVRVNINENTIRLTPHDKNPDELFSFPFLTNPNHWERIRLDELAL